MYKIVNVCHYFITVKHSSHKSHQVFLHRILFNFFFSFSFKDKEQKVVSEGWEYAPLFNMKFHHKERRMDLVRRRRWHRKMIATDPKAPCFFELKSKSSDSDSVSIWVAIFKVRCLYTVKTSEERPSTGPQKVILYDRWSFIGDKNAGSCYCKSGLSSEVSFLSQWPLIAVISPSRFYCIA